MHTLKEKCQSERKKITELEMGGVNEEGGQRRRRRALEPSNRVGFQKDVLYLDDSYAPVDRAEHGCRFSEKKSDLTVINPQAFLSPHTMRP